ncbi:MAG: regulatory protein RecX [Rubrivivax sp.]
MPGHSLALSVKGRALRLLAQREHTRTELERKLRQRLREQPEALAQIGPALDSLAAAGLLSDRRAADALATAQSRRFGDARVRFTMRSRGLADDQIRDALATLPGTELSRAREIWQRRFGGAPAADVVERVRQARFLAGRGFSSETIRRVVRGLSDPD